MCGQDKIIHPWYKRIFTQEMRCGEIFGQGNRNIEGVFNDFIHLSTLTLVVDYGLIVDRTVSHS